jgi:hypothetical protein
MNRSLAFTVPVALAACFALTGCTIYTNTSTPNNKRPAKTKPVATTKKPGIHPRPGSGTGGAAATSDTTEAPVVKSTTLFGGGEQAAFHGDAYVIPEDTTRMPNFDDLVPFAQLYTDQFNVSPQTFSGGFPGALLQDEWFGIRYVGHIVAPVTTKWTFKLVSDDGAVLYIDNKKVIDNDGVHTAKTATGDIDLEAGKHALRLDYFQEKKGSVALQLFAVVGGKDVPVTGLR